MHGQQNVKKKTVSTVEDDLSFIKGAGQDMDIVSLLPRGVKVKI